jgi:hypothetical protein
MIFVEHVAVGLGMRTLSGLPDNDSERKPLKNLQLEWLRKKQNVVIPILPITSPDARHQFFQWIPQFMATKISLADMFCQMVIKWNQAADGNSIFYITIDILKAFLANWERVQNIRASINMLGGSNQLPYSLEANFPAGFAMPTD